MPSRPAPPTLSMATLAVCAFLALPCTAESLGSSASSASSAGSASSGSLSDTVTGASDDATRTAASANGLYQVLTVADVAGRPGVISLHLRPQAVQGGEPTAQDLWLRLPRAALDSRGLAGGSLVQVHARPYGLAFAYADERRGAFFLALHDTWQRGLAAQPL